MKPTLKLPKALKSHMQVSNNSLSLFQLLLQLPLLHCAKMLKLLNFNQVLIPTLQVEIHIMSILNLMQHTLQGLVQELQQLVVLILSLETVLL